MSDLQNNFKKFIRGRRFGFTLAEVLITLGIIGVIAALTIPTLVQNANERAIVVAVKKVYSILASAYTLAAQENGTPEQWGITGANNESGEIMINKIKPYMNVSKDCSVTGTHGCFADGLIYKQLDGADWILVNNAGKSILLTDGTGVYAVALANCDWPLGSGAFLQAVCGDIVVDVNGFKSPNTLGKDVFLFYLTKYGIVPQGSQLETNTKFIGSCLTSSGGFGNGWGCTAWVLDRENLDYVKCPTILKAGWTGPMHCN